MESAYTGFYENIQDSPAVHFLKFYPPKLSLLLTE